MISLEIGRRDSGISLSLANTQCIRIGAIMKKSEKSIIDDTTRIAGEYNIRQWSEFREDLINDLKTGGAESGLWEKAFGIFKNRIQSRFLGPIEKILGAGKYEGEGFAAMALQCTLLEFLQAFYEGKIYVTKEEKHLAPFEYRSSRMLFENFLTRRVPFKLHFNNKLAGSFYDTVRCGLFHMAATKGEARIRADVGRLVTPTLKGEVGVVDRTIFFKYLIECIDNYRTELLSSNELKKNFIGKMDELAGFQKTYLAGEE
jgi:hypothetical protein